VIRISISQAAFAAVCASLPPGSVATEAQLDERGDRCVWLDEVWVNRLGAMRRHGES
jgi:hypothetical protein